MGKFYKILFRTFGIIIIGIAIVVGLFLTGAVESPVFLDIYSTKSYDQMQEEQTQGNKTKETSLTNQSSVPSALNITLSGKYLTAYETAMQSLSDDDLKSKMIIKIGLQILQQGVITYELDYHYYSITYKNSGNTAHAQFYNLKNCIDLINKKQKIYTDCFGFARLTYSIACYTLNSSNPAGVEGLNQMYGYQGGYGNGAYITKLSSLKGGAMLYDTLTGCGSSKNRHVAIFLYARDRSVTYMDQSGIHTGEFTTSNYIYYAKSSNPYKFNKFRVFC